MRCLRYIGTLLLVLVMWAGVTTMALADSPGKVKTGIKKVWSDVKDTAKDTGRAVRDEAVEVGKDAKQGYRDTKEAVKSKFKGKKKKDE